MMEEPIRPRLMLLTGARSYRAGAFHQAAEQLGIDVTPVVNMSRELADHWEQAQGFDFDDPGAAQAIAELARRRSISAVLAVDDSGTLIAARVAELLGLPHNSPESAYAARDKHRMRDRMDAAGVPCPWFRALLHRRRSPGRGPTDSLPLRGQAAQSERQPRRHPCRQRR